MPGESGLQQRWLPGPVQHVRAGDMDKAEGMPVLPWMPDDVVQVINPIKEEGRVRIPRQALATGMHQVNIQIGFCRFIHESVKPDRGSKGFLFALSR
jgi:hypothetical protein